MATFTTDAYAAFPTGNSGQPKMYALRKNNCCRLLTGNAMIGDAVTKLEIYVQANGTPTGTLSAHVWDTTDSTVTNYKETSSTTFDASTIDPDDPQLLTFFFSGTYAMDANSAVGVYYSEVGSIETTSLYAFMDGGDIANNCQATQFNSGVWEYEGGAGSGEDNPAVQITHSTPVVPSSGTLLPPPYANIGLSGL